MKNILFTGLTGFLGKNFQSLIKDRDMHVFPLPCDILSGHGKITDFTYHFSKEDLLKENINTIDVLVHAGAFSPKTREQMNDIDNNILNITNTQHLLNNLPTLPKKIIYISSISVYNIPSLEVVNEFSPTEGDSIYGLSKLMSEKIVIEFAKKNNIDCQILRLGVMYGNNKGYQGLIPSFIQNIMENKPICTFNDGVELKNFIHVQDVCEVIYQSILQDSSDYPIINVVNTDNISVKDVAKKLISLSNKNINIDTVQKNQTHQITFDTTLLQKAFQLQQKSYNKGLEESFNFFTKECT